MNNLFYPSKTDNDKQKIEKQFNSELQKLIDVYVKYYGEKYKQQIENDIAAATFIHIGDTQKARILDEKTLCSRFCNSVQEKLYERFKKDYKIDNEVLADIISGNGGYEDETSLLDKWLITGLSLFDFYKNCNKEEQSLIKKVILSSEKLLPKILFHEFRTAFFGYKKSDFDKVGQKLRRLRTDWVELYFLDDETITEAQNAYHIPSCKASLISNAILTSRFFNTDYTDLTRLLYRKNLNLEDKASILLDARERLFTQGIDEQYFSEILPKKIWEIISHNASAARLLDPKDKNFLDKSFEDFVYHSQYSDKIKSFLEKVVEREKIVTQVCDDVYQDHIYDFDRLHREIENVCQGFFFDDRKLKLLQDMLERKIDKEGLVTCGFVSNLSYTDFFGKKSFTAIFDDKPLSYIIHEINHLISPKTTLPYYLNEIFTEFVACSVAEKAKALGISFKSKDVHDSNMVYRELFCLSDLFDQYKKEFVKAYIDGDLTDLKNALGNNLDKISNICDQYFEHHSNLQKRLQLKGELMKTIDQIIVQPNQKDNKNEKQFADEFNHHI